MKIPLSWLKEYIDLPFSADHLAQTLTLAGLEVDQVSCFTPSFQGVVVAKILDTKPHPNADLLKIATVFDGKEHLQVVCKAPNCRPGLVSAFARIGATLQDEQGKHWTIKKSKLRDVESFGMLCAADELGLEASSSGILEFPEDAPIGQELSSLYEDTFFEITRPPTLGHCMSIYGIARELSASLQKPLKSWQVKPFDKAIGGCPVKVTVQENAHTTRYSCRIVQKIEVKPSPAWLSHRLEQVGIRSINNVIDISQYIMMLTGQPLHFFDADTLEGSSVIVRPSKKGEQITTLDGAKHTLPENAILICDEKKPIALAGIMGCLESSITEKTKNVLIESAIFLPSAIRKTTKALGFKTDASNRFDKGVDPLACMDALDYATHLLMQEANGQSYTQATDHITRPFSYKKITCRQERVSKMIGIPISLTEIKGLLERLQIKTLHEHMHSIEVQIPSFRNDIHEEIDLIEEIARLYGFNNLPKKDPLHYTSSLADSPMFSFENSIRSLLLQEGLQEMMTCDLISPSLSCLTQEHTQNFCKTLSVLQSKSSDYSVLRHTLLAGHLQMVKHNIDHETRDIAGFEVGRIHYQRNDGYQEYPTAGIVLSGSSSPHHHDPKTRSVDFFDLKGTVENLMQSLHIEGIFFEPSHLQSFQPGRQAYVKKGDLTLGVLGEIHPSTLSQIDIDQRVYFAEINLLELMAIVPTNITSYELPLYPSSERDWTVSLKKDAPVGKVLDALKEYAPAFLEKVFLLDLFEGKSLGENRKNATWRFIYRDPQKTLDLATVEDLHTKLLQKVAEKLQDCIW